MTLPTTGPMKASAIRTELKASGKFDIGATNYRKLARKTRGLIKFSDFRGKSNTKAYRIRGTHTGTFAEKAYGTAGTYVAASSWSVYMSKSTLGRPVPAFASAPSGASFTAHFAALVHKFFGFTIGPSYGGLTSGQPPTGAYFRITPPIGKKVVSASGHVTVKISPSFGSAQSFTIAPSTTSSILGAYVRFSTSPIVAFLNAHKTFLKGTRITVTVDLTVNCG